MVEFKDGDIYIEIVDDAVKQWVRAGTDWYFIENGVPNAHASFVDGALESAFAYMNKHSPGLCGVMRGEDVLTIDGIQSW